jgi:hypothetical protein
MFETAVLKVDRAKRHISDLNSLLQKERPFSLIFEADANTGECATVVKENEAVIRSCAVTIGDAIHNLRAALDHVVWELVSPFCTTAAERRKVQFPFANSAQGLDRAIEQRLIDRTAPEIADKIKRLKPYPGGYELLYLVDELDILDKHKLLIPTGDYSQINARDLSGQIPDIPQWGGTMTFMSVKRLFAWHRPPLPAEEFVKFGVPPSGKVEKVLDAPINIAFIGGTTDEFYPAVPTLHVLVNTVEDVIEYLRPTTGVEPPPGFRSS